MRCLLLRGGRVFGILDAPVEERDHQVRALARGGDILGKGLEIHRRDTRRVHICVWAARGNLIVAQQRDPRAFDCLYGRLSCLRQVVAAAAGRDIVLVECV